MIRKFQEKDYKTVENILQREFHTNYPQENPFLQCFVAEIENKVVGFICYSLIYEQIELDYIYVDLNYRHQKIATKLMNVMIDEATDAKVNTITLEVNEHNIGAQKLYEKFEFQVCTIRKNYYNHADGLLMIRKLM